MLSIYFFIRSCTEIRITTILGHVGCIFHSLIPLRKVVETFYPFLVLFAIFSLMHSNPMTFVWTFWVCLSASVGLMVQLREGILHRNRHHKDYEAFTVSHSHLYQFQPTNHHLMVDQGFFSPVRGTFKVN